VVVKPKKLLALMASFATGQECKQAQPQRFKAGKRLRSA
jgi:hypothetical protein